MVAGGCFLPQQSEAALVTVGGDGGTGSVTLSNPSDAVNFGGVLAGSILYTQQGKP